jgi:hypothetical protein
VRRERETRAATDERDPVPRPGLRRPLAVELAAAILIVSALVGIITAVGVGLTGSPDPFLWVGIVLNAGSLVLGLATRAGRLWIVTLNYVAVLGFLDLLGAAASPQALMVGLGEVLVVVLLIIRKPWFDAVAEARRGSAQGPDQPLTPPTARPPIR